MRVALLVALLVTVSCDDDVVVLQPVIEAPARDSDAHPYDGVTTLALSVARAGETTDLTRVEIAPGQELYLPSVPYGDNLVVHLSGSAEEVEIAYGRTCALRGGTETPPTELAPRLYLSRIVKWGTVADLSPQSSQSRHGYSLPDGSAVYLGGGDSAGLIERFDPLASGRFTALAGQAIDREKTSLALLRASHAVIVGGVNSSGDAVADIEVIDAMASTADNQVINYPGGPRLRDHAAVSLVDGTVLVAGGSAQAAAGGSFLPTADAWALRLGPGSSLEAPRRLPAAMLTARAEHSLTRLGDEVGADVLVVGGRDATGAPVATAELYRPLRDSFELVEAASLARWGHSAARLPGSFVLILGGYKPDPEGGPEPVPALDMQLYDPHQGRFSEAGELPSDAGLTDLTITHLPDGRLLLAGGRDLTGAAVSSVHIARLDPVDGLVDISITDALAAPRAGHAAVSLCDGTIMVVGGGAGPERYNPPSADRR